MASGAAPDHVPVLAEAAAEWLVWRPDGTYVDATLGAGGHAAAICRRLVGAGALVGIDRDPAAHELARARLAPWNDRVQQHVGPFGRLDDALDRAGVSTVAGVLFDLGVSSIQLDSAERGFSFRFGGPLDMRMGPDAELRAWDIVNTWSQEDLTRVLRQYGEEPAARPIARAICRARSQRSIDRTDDLAEIVGRRGRGQPEKTLARVFQAIRIVINRELDELEQGLGHALDRTEPGGRIAVIAYHSIEDRIAKRFMRHEASDCICPPDVPICRCNHQPRLRILTRHVVTPTGEEVAANPRARSARMRVAERLRDAERAEQTGETA